MQEISRKDFVRLSATFLGAAVAAACSDSKKDATSSGGSSGDESSSGVGTSTSSSGSSSGTSSSSSSGSSTSGGSSSSGSSSGDPVDAGRDTGPDATASACGMNKSFMQGAGITSSHPHSFTIPLADFMGNVDKTYTLIGTNPHTVNITGAQFAMLRAGMTVSVVSSVANGHTHACAIKC